MLRSLVPDHQRVLLSWSDLGVTSWSEAAQHAEASDPKRTGEQVRRRVRYVVDEQRRRTGKGRAMNSLVAWTFVLVSFVAVLVVREAYRKERLGAALLVGVSVATLLLLLVGIDGGANIPARRCLFLRRRCRRRRGGCTRTLTFMSVGERSHRRGRRTCTDCATKRFATCEGPPSESLGRSETAGLSQTRKKIRTRLNANATPSVGAGELFNDDASAGV